MGVDIGGVYRDMLSSFWDEACRRLFDGSAPVLHPQVDMAILPVLGKVLSHGYLATGFLSVQVCFLVLTVVLLKCTDIKEDFLVRAFLSQSSVAAEGVLRRCLKVKEFSSDDQAQLITIFSVVRLCPLGNANWEPQCPANSVPSQRGHSGTELMVTPPTN